MRKISTLHFPVSILSGHAGAVCVHILVGCTYAILSLCVLRMWHLVCPFGLAVSKIIFKSPIKGMGRKKLKRDDKISFL